MVTAEPITKRSWTLRVYPEGAPIDASPYIALLRLDDLGGGVCEIAATMGELSDDTNIAIGLKAMELGFRVLQFSALHDQTVTRYAERIGSDETFHYYRADLKKTALELGEQG